MEESSKSRGCDELTEIGNASILVLRYQPPPQPSINSNILVSLNSFQPPLMVGMMTTSPSKNIDIISRVAEKGIGVNSSGIYGATKNVARLVTH